MLHSEGRNINESDAIRYFYDHDERLDGIGEYEVEIADFPNFMTLDVDEDTRFPMPPIFSPPPPGINPNMPPGQSQGPNQGSGPPGPPPSQIPSKQSAQKSAGGGPQLKFVSPGTLRPCLFRYVFIWQTNGRSYWAYLTILTPKSIAGWRWSGFRWQWFGLDLRFIESFVCY